jgi:hypothetical protein
MLSRADMLQIFNTVAADGHVSATEFNDLKVIAGDTTTVVMPAPVRVLSKKVVLGNVANANYQGAALGNLVAGDDASRLTKLVNKWFLGLDHPVAKWGYAQASGSLFGTDGPSYGDIVQGEVGDCYLMAALGGVVRQNATSITQMFTDNGDGTFTVRYYISGVADYVTVDEYLPTSGGVFLYANLGKRLDESDNVLWVALAEKAYAEENESGGLGRSVSANSYASIDSGNPGLATTQITDRANTSLQTNNLTFAAIRTQFDAGKAITFGTKPTTSAGIVPNHAYAVVGYDPVAMTITLFNPWGLASQADPGLITLTIAQIQANCYGWWYC